MFEIEGYSSDMKIARFATAIERGKGWIRQKLIGKRWLDFYDEDINDYQVQYIREALNEMRIEVR